MDLTSCSATFKPATQTSEARQVQMNSNANLHANSANACAWYTLPIEFCPHATHTDNCLSLSDPQCTKLCNFNYHTAYCIPPRRLLPTSSVQPLMTCYSALPSCLVAPPQMLLASGGGPHRTRRRGSCGCTFPPGRRAPAPRPPPQSGARSPAPAIIGGVRGSGFCRRKLRSGQALRSALCAVDAGLVPFLSVAAHNP
jgi:hypothetical protein